MVFALSKMKEQGVFRTHHLRGSHESQVRIQQPLSRHLFLCQSKRQWQAIINARFSAKSRSPHLFTLRKKRHSSSSWAGKSPNFRREIRQSHYRNDPVKWAKIPSVTDASAPRFHQCSPNYKYQQLLSFMAV